MLEASTCVATEGLTLQQSSYVPQQITQQLANTKQNFQLCQGWRKAKATLGVSKNLTKQTNKACQQLTICLHHKSLHAGLVGLASLL